MRDRYSEHRGRGLRCQSCRRFLDFARAWPLLDPAGIVADLWTVPAYLRSCAPWLSADEIRMLQRREPRIWTVSDLPFLDAARLRVGDPKAARRTRERAVALAAVGDRAQARHGFTESWQEPLKRIGLEKIQLASLSINYRTPQEVMAEAEPVIGAALPDANVPTSVRSGGASVVHRAASDLGSILDTWLSTHVDGIACVIGDPTFTGMARVGSLAPELAKGLEFDLVILVDPEAFGSGIEGAVDRYVAMTRATQQLVILSTAGGGARPVEDKVEKIADHEVQMNQSRLTEAI